MEKQKIVIIGAGPGGIAAAIRATELGAEAILIEEKKLGGVCLHEGCIPTKTLLAGAKRFLEINEAENLGLKVSQPEVNWLSMLIRKERVIADLQKKLSTLLFRKRIRVVFGKAIIASPKKIIVTGLEGEQGFQADKVIIATGSLPLKLGQVDWSSPAVLTPQEALNLKALPQKIIIIGGGVTGVEFATLFSALGKKVILVEVLEDILATEDLRIRQAVSQNLRNQGVEIITGTAFLEIKGYFENLAGVKLAENKELLAEKVLVTIGRKPNTKGLGLERIGLATTDKGFVVVNEKMETNIEGVYAIGDLTGKMMLAHYAQKSGELAVENALGANLKINHLIIPRCIYTIPEAASVGLNREEAESQGYEVKTNRVYFSDNPMAQASGKTFGFLQLVFDISSKRILGAQILGEGACEIIHQISLAINQGLTIRELGNLVFSHPTFSEIVKEALGGKG